MHTDDQLSRQVERNDEFVDEEQKKKKKKRSADKNVGQTSANNRNHGEPKRKEQKRGIIKNIKMYTWKRIAVHDYCLSSFCEFKSIGGQAQMLHVDLILKIF